MMAQPSLFTGTVTGKPESEAFPSGPPGSAEYKKVQAKGDPPSRPTECEEDAERPLAIIVGQITYQCDWVSPASLDYYNYETKEQTKTQRRKCK